jgi:hypothetical protein
VPSASFPFKVSERLGLLWETIPGLKKEVGERLGSLREKVTGHKKDGLVARLRSVGKILFGILCLLLIEGWAVCVATKDQTIRLATYAVKRFKAWRGSGDKSHLSIRLLPNDSTEWRRVALGYSVIIVVVWMILPGRHSTVSTTAAASTKKRAASTTATAFTEKPAASAGTVAVDHDVQDDQRLPDDPVTLFKQLTALRAGIKLEPFNLSCVIVSQLADNKYEVVVGDEHAILRTQTIHFQSTGDATIPVVAARKTHVQTKDGFVQEWPVYEQAMSHAGAIALSEEMVDRKLSKLQDRIESTLHQLIANLLDSGYTGQDEAELARRLHAAVTESNSDVLSEIQQELAVPIKAGYGSLHYAVRIGNLSLIRSLVENGHRLTTRTHDGLTPLHVAVVEHFQSAKDIGLLLQTLEAVGATIDEPDAKGRTVLHAAVEIANGNPSNDKELVEAVVKQGANVNAADSLGQTPLHVACRMGKAYVVEALLANGANPALRDQHGRTPADQTQDPRLLKALQKSSALEKR